MSQQEPAWRNEKHRAQWRMTLGEAYCRNLQKMPVSEIGNDDILNALSPIWQTRHETASRIRGRIERVLNFAKVKGWRAGENPAMWRGNLENVLPRRQKLTRGHHPAMPYAVIPEFMENLKGHQALAARALELLILTATRSGEVLQAQWQEFDLEKRVWTIPMHRTKTNRQHRIPLTDAVIRILQPLRDASIGDYVFPGQVKDQPLSNMAMHMLLRRMKIDGITVHGFRSSFRDWAGDETTFPREIAESCLAHSVGNDVEQAYRRSDALEKRRLLLSAWSDYCSGNTPSNVVRMHERELNSVGNS